MSSQLPHGLAVAGSFDVERLRAEFPILERRIHGLPLVYFDNGATAQKPQAVIDALVEFYTAGCANVHRGVHTLSQEATAAYDAAREIGRKFLNAADSAEIVFTAGTTAALNLLAAGLGSERLAPGDEILVTELDHHSNLVPWHLVAARTGAVIKAIPIDGDGCLDLTLARERITSRTRIVALTHASNVLGVVTPVRQIADLAHAVGAVVVVDGAQSAPHFPIDVQALGCDFFVFSGHKLFGPMGVGLLYGRLPLLAELPVESGGGGMIVSVEIDRSTYTAPPARFEAGTPPVAEAIGLGAAMQWLAALDRDAIADHETDLVDYADAALRSVPGVQVFGPRTDRVSVLSFVVDGVHAHDVGTILDRSGVAVRVGHHCAQPLMKRLGVAATVRASFAPYNTRAEIDTMVEAVVRTKEVFGV